MKNRILNSKAMSIPEALLAIVIGLIAIGSVLGIWYLTYRTWAVEHVRNRMRVNLEIGLENIKNDVRLSTTSHMSYYPSGVGPYTAISIPGADRDVNGFFTLDANRLIIWDRTIVYHVYTSGGVTELRKTVFDPRDNTLTSVQRLAQLTSVVTNGDGSSAANGGNSTTSTLFEHVVALSILPKAGEFDGYNPTRIQSNFMEFGSIRLVSGYHTIKFQVTGQNSSSTGYGIGVDAFSISPSGGLREAEIFIPPFASSGETASKVFVEGWSGNNFMNYTSNGVGDYVTLRFYYDMWHESNFENSTRDNTYLDGNDIYATMAEFAQPEDVDAADDPKWSDSMDNIVWEAGVEGSSANGDAEKADYIPTGAIDVKGITVRNLLSSANVSDDLDVIRVKFEAHSANPVTNPTAIPIKILAAYIDERDSVTANQNAVDPPTTASRIQLFFTTDPTTNQYSSTLATSIVTPGITIPAGGGAYSNLAIFDIDETKDYFITFYIDISAPSYASFWQGTLSTDVNSYLRRGNYPATASWPIGSSEGHKQVLGAELPTALDGQWTSTPHVYVTASLEGWVDTGTVTSRIYDTQVANPGYNLIDWDEYKPSSTTVQFKVRSSDDEDMAGATGWDALAWMSSKPSGLTIGAGRYVQFRGELSVAPHWTCKDHSAVNVTDAAYKAGTTTCGTCALPLRPVVSGFPWLDNVEIDWPGETHVCDIGAYMTKDSDYGIIKVSIDDTDLVKGLEFTITLSDDVLSTTYEHTLSAEVEPRNTGQ